MKFSIVLIIIGLAQSSSGFYPSYLYESLENAIFDPHSRDWVRSEISRYREKASNSADKWSQYHHLVADFLEECLNKAVQLSPNDQLRYRLFVNPCDVLTGSKMTRRLAVLADELDSRDQAARSPKTSTADTQPTAFTTTTIPTVTSTLHSEVRAQPSPNTLVPVQTPSHVQIGDWVTTTSTPTSSTTVAISSTTPIPVLNNTFVGSTDVHSHLLAGVLAGSLLALVISFLIALLCWKKIKMAHEMLPLPPPPVSYSALIARTRALEALSPSPSEEDILFGISRPSISTI